MFTNTLECSRKYLPFNQSASVEVAIGSDMGESLWQSPMKIRFRPTLMEGHSYPRWYAIVHGTRVNDGAMS